MSKNIFIINPGSTSTKIAYYEDEAMVYTESIAHQHSDLAGFESIEAQSDFRYECILKSIADHNVDVSKLDIVMGRGGLFPPVKGGAYIVDDDLIELIESGKIEKHASNLGAPLALAVSGASGSPAFVYDSVSVDEFPEISKITGVPEVLRQSFCHVLNSKAVARRYAESIGKKYEDINCVVAHLGGGFTFSAHQKGKIVDSLSDDSGAFAPERGGSIPVLYIIDMCYSGEYSKNEMRRKIRGVGGLWALLGTSDCREVERKIAEGDERAKLVYDAMILQIAKGIGLVSPILKGDIDVIILTGGVAHSSYITEAVIDYSISLAPIEIIAGEFEMEALAEAGVRLLAGEEYNTLSGGVGRLK